MYKILQAEDMGPCLALPSISEDDENQLEEVVSLSPHLPSLTRSPLHSLASPRHGKFLQR